MAMWLKREAARRLPQYVRLLLLLPHHRYGDGVVVKRRPFLADTGAFHENLNQKRENTIRRLRRLLLLHLLTNTYTTHEASRPQKLRSV